MRIHKRTKNKKKINFKILTLRIEKNTTHNNNTKKLLYYIISYRLYSTTNCTPPFFKLKEIYTKSVISKDSLA